MAFVKKNPCHLLVSHIRRKKHSLDEAREREMCSDVFVLTNAALWAELLSADGDSSSKGSKPGMSGVTILSFCEL